MKLIDLLKENTSTSTSTSAVTVNLGKRDTRFKAKPINSKDYPSVFWQEVKKFDDEWKKLLEKEKEKVVRYRNNAKERDEREKKEFPHLHYAKHWGETERTKEWEKFKDEEYLYRMMKNEKLLLLRNTNKKLHSIILKYVGPKKPLGKDVIEKLYKIDNLIKTTIDDWKKNISSKTPYRLF